MTLSKEIIEGAQNAQRIWGVPACVGLAQCIIESAGFKFTPPNSFNGLGIKALKGLPSVACETHEVIHGRSVGISAHFAKFDSVQECFYYWGKLLAENHVYADAFAAKDSWLIFVEKMAPHYATDPNYAHKLINLINVDRLTAYNLKLPTSDPSTSSGLTS